MLKLTIDHVSIQVQVPECPISACSGGWKDDLGKSVRFCKGELNWNRKNNHIYPGKENCEEKDFALIMLF